MQEHHELITLHAGKYLTLVAQGHWEFATRTTARPGVAIVALTDDDRVILVRQHRIPVGRSVIELPAGLVGDTPDAKDEELLVAAQRELLEETGYTARDWTELIRGLSSPGLSDESIVFYLAEGLEKVAEGGGDESEAITVYEVPRHDVLAWVTERKDAVSIMLFAGLHAAEVRLRTRSRQGTS
ncbi:MAG: NUDIX hydrolase [Pirellulaceae bacterium]|nr:NUDIX hydrolase [Planctomycetales bacterium]